MNWIVISHCEAINNGKEVQFIREIAMFDDPWQAEDFIKKCLPKERQDAFEVIRKQ